MIFVVIILFITGCSNNADEAVNELIAQGQTYLREENYQNALSSFEEAMKADDKRVEAYIGAADAYSGMEDYGTAIDILVRGFEKTHDELFHKKVDEINELQKLHSQENLKETGENNEYTLNVGDQFYQIDRNLILKSVLENARVESVPSDGPFPDGKRYYGDGIIISTFIVDDERGQGEVIYNITATKDGKSPRGVGIGDTLDALQKAYPDLIYLNGYYSYENEPKYNRCYAYAPDDGTTHFMQFYLHEKKIVMIEAGDGLDMRPGSWQPYDNIFGMKNVYKQIEHVTSKGMETKYFYINDAGEEEILLDISSRSVEENDIDEDGKTELVVYQPGNSMGIYDFVNGQITYTDINETLQCSSSGFIANMSNVRHEYEKCIEAGFKNEDGTFRSEVYRYSDNELIYIGPFSDELLM
jgi:hypothetical protein